GVADTNVSPAGSMSRIVTFVAVLGPLPVTVIVKVISSPTLGRALLTILPTCASASCGLTDAVSLLLVRSGAHWSTPVVLAVFVCGLGVFTREVMVSVWVAPKATAPTVQVRVAGSKLPADGDDDRKLTPTGSTSCTMTPVALSGPLLVTRIV